MLFRFIKCAIGIKFYKDDNGFIKKIHMEDEFVTVEDIHKMEWSTRPRIHVDAY